MIARIACGASFADYSCFSRDWSRDSISSVILGIDFAIGGFDDPSPS
jgi:hypothetical protein